MKKVMNKKELHDFKYGFRKIYKLPYTAKNGIRFSDNGVSMVTQYGIVFSSNGYLGNEKYYPMLMHVETAGDGSTKYDVSVDVTGKSNSDLERLAGAIKSNLKRNAELRLKELERMGA